MKLFKTSYLITLISTALILTSCGSSSDFSKRKFRKGIFKERSVRIKENKSKAEEPFFTSKSSLESIKVTEEPALLQSAEIKVNDTLLAIRNEVRSKEKNSRVQIVANSISFSKKEFSRSRNEAKKRSYDSTEKKKKFKAPERLIKTSLIIGWISLILLLILVTLIFLGILLLGFSIIGLIVTVALTALLMSLNIVLTAKITGRLKRDDTLTYNEWNQLKKARIINILCIAIPGLALAALLIWMVYLVISTLIDFF